MKLRSLLITLALAMVMAMLSACATTARAPLPSEHARIGAACDVATTGLEAVTAAFTANVVPRSALVDALAIHQSTDRFCRPVADHLTPTDYAELLAAGARIAAKKEVRK